MPFTAFRNIWGKLCKHGCWHGSMTLGLAIAYCRNACVCETTAGLHRSTGSPIVRNSLYHACATASSDIVDGTSCVSSSPVNIEFCYITMRALLNACGLLKTHTYFQFGKHRPVHNVQQPRRKSEAYAIPLFHQGQSVTPSQAGLS